MAQDQQTYSRAVTAALAGLIVQIILTIAMGLGGAWAQSPAMSDATWYLAGGIPIWLILIILYHQHRLERQEALEAERLARTDAASAAIFDEHADDLAVARRRLERLYKWGLNLVAGGVAVYLLLLGIIFLSAKLSLFAVDEATANVTQQAGELSPDKLKTEALGATVNTMMLIFLAAGIALLGFVVARYEAGMTRIRHWQLLRGGASYLMGNVLVAVLTLIAAVGAQFGLRQAMGWLALVVPLVMMLAGIEMLVTLLLTAYRPRRPGEIPRPAFDSRLFGLLTTPESLAKAVSDTLNYQFGFEISRSWFYQTLTRSVTPLTVIGIVAMLLMSTIVIVKPHEQAVVMRLGALTTTEAIGPGIHLKWPWPIGRVMKYPTGRVLQVEVGSAKEEIPRGTAILWTNQHAGQEDYLVTAPSPLTERMLGEEGRSTGMSLVGAKVAVQYRVKDLPAYLQSGVDSPDDRVRRRIIHDIAEGQVNAYFATKDIDTLIGIGRIHASADMREAIQRAVDRHEMGVEILFVGLTGIHPPNEENVAKEFLAQINALLEQQNAIEQARQQAIETLAAVAGSEEEARLIDEVIQELQDLRIETRAGDPRERERRIEELEGRIDELLLRARGEAAKLLYEASAYKWLRISAQQSKVRQFEAELLAFRGAPEYYRARRFLQTIGSQMEKTRKIVIWKSGDEKPMIRLDLTRASDPLNPANLGGGEN